jgi:hypothetical protein
VADIHQPPCFFPLLRIHVQAPNLHPGDERGWPLMALSATGFPALHVI